MYRKGMTYFESLCKKAASIYFIVALILDNNVENITAKPQSNPCLVLKLPLCSINPNFGSNHETSGQNPSLEESRRQEGNRLPLRQPPLIQTKTHLSNEELEVSSLLDKFLKSTEDKPADRTPTSNNEPLPPIPTIQTTVSTNGKVRSDRRCGAEFPLADGNVSECNPNSPNHCCSKWGYCGPGAEHCDCPECVDYRTANSPDVPEFTGNVRTDRRCGSEFPLPGGGPSQCDPNGANHCCSKWGYCGPDAEHCECAECVDYKRADVKVLTAFGGKVRSDRRCGKEFPLQDGAPSECDPTSPNPCCSKWGFCGPDADHCACPECVDYRPQEQKAIDDFVGKVRKDRRCGPEFPLPGGDGVPSECNPNSEKFCCSKWGYCGGDAEHCDCPECVNYKFQEASVDLSFAVPTVRSVARRPPVTNTRDISKLRATTTRPKSFNQYEEYVYYDY